MKFHFRRILSEGCWNEESDDPAPWTASLKVAQMIVAYLALRINGGHWHGEEADEIYRGKTWEEVLK